MKIIYVGVLASLLFLGACTNLNKTEQGALTGVAGGALVGAGISAIAGGSGTIGALIGGALGGIAGGMVGHHEQKKQ